MSRMMNGLLSGLVQAVHGYRQVERDLNRQYLEEDRLAEERVNNANRRRYLSELTRTSRLKNDEIENARRYSGAARAIIGDNGRLKSLDDLMADGSAGDVLRQVKHADPESWAELSKGGRIIDRTFRGDENNIYYDITKDNGRTRETVAIPRQQAQFMYDNLLSQVGSYTPVNRHSMSALHELGGGERPVNRHTAPAIPVQSAQPAPRVNDSAVRMDVLGELANLDGAPTKSATNGYGLSEIPADDYDLEAARETRNPDPEDPDTQEYYARTLAKSSVPTEQIRSALDKLTFVTPDVKREVLGMVSRFRNEPATKERFATPDDIAYTHSPLATGKAELRPASENFGATPDDIAYAASPLATGKAELRPASDFSQQPEATPLRATGPGQIPALLDGAMDKVSDYATQANTAGKKFYYDTVEPAIRGGLNDLDTAVRGITIKKAPAGGAPATPLVSGINAAIAARPTPEINDDAVDNIRIVERLADATSGYAKDRVDAFKDPTPLVSGINAAIAARPTPEINDDAVDNIRIGERLADAARNYAKDRVDAFKDTTFVRDQEETPFPEDGTFAEKAGHVVRDGMLALAAPFEVMYKDAGKRGTMVMEGIGNFISGLHGHGGGPDKPTKKAPPIDMVKRPDLAADAVEAAKTQAPAAAEFAAVTNGPLALAELEGGKRKTKSDRARIGMQLMMSGLMTKDQMLTYVQTGDATRTVSEIRENNANRVKYLEQANQAYATARNMMRQGALDVVKKNLDVGHKHFDLMAKSVSMIAPHATPNWWLLEKGQQEQVLAEVFNKVQVTNSLYNLDLTDPASTAMLQTAAAITGRVRAKLNDKWFGDDVTFVSYNIGMAAARAGIANDEGAIEEMGHYAEALSRKHKGNISAVTAELARYSDWKVKNPDGKLIDFLKQ